MGRVDAEPIPESFTPDLHDLQYLKEQDYALAHYFLQPTTPGPIHACPHGKYLCIAASYHAVTVSWGLEDNSLAGPNKDARKGRKLRQFILPSHYVEPDSSPLQSRTNQIFAAIVNPVYAWAFTSLDRFGSSMIASSLSSSLVQIGMMSKIKHIKSLYLWNF
ncbi:hypothetical protein BDP27DRAFT_1367005 [Rhodocollybia butyracea]|uniref:Uncharacterized protein n=1 Tax=Rhodocollybia butyracea TaxID=206335 RepID=A0A9P5PK59_9AGAR|nr:hypothetical protein BDP27DRAFT_1367005 [Rhodocollybia butyracea]